MGECLPRCSPELSTGMHLLTHSCSSFKSSTKIMALVPPGHLHLQSPSLSFLLFQVFLYLVLLVPPAISLSFNFPSFNHSVWYTTIMPQVDAQLSSNDSSIIDLTVNSNHSTGRVLYNFPVQLYNKKRILTNFTSHFSFTIRKSSGSPGNGDGLAFILAPYGSLIQYFDGGGFGVFTDPTKYRANPIVAVEFDTYKNTWDSDSNHIGVDIHSVQSTSRASCNSTFWNSMIDDSNPWEAWVSYDSSSLNLNAVFTCANKSVRDENCSVDYVVDLREYLTEKVSVGFSASTGYCFDLHQLNSWDFTSSLENEVNSNDTGMVVGLVVGGVAMIIAVLVMILFFRRWRKNQKSKADAEVGLDVPTGPREFSHAELAGATNNFDEKRKLGEGGFGGVYRGFLNDLKMDVAVKRISKGSKQGKKEYSSEVKIISRLRHRNLVQLVGWCHQRKELLLVYEFMPNGSLDFHLFRNRGSLTWELRYKIALHLASALQYLHEGWEQCVVHRDIKSSNIILDSNFHAKLGDFGLARLMEHEKGSETTNVAAGTMGWPVEHEKGSQLTTAVAGTMGYMAPEYVITGMASKETDVYSFGIVLLEIACGRKAVEMMVDPSEISLVEWVWLLYGRQKHLEAADPSQAMDSGKQQLIEYMIIAGLWCAQQDYNLRPSIGQAINVLKFDAPLPFLPFSVRVAPPSNISTFSITSSYEHSSKSCPTDSTSLNMSSTASSSSIQRHPSCRIHGKQNCNMLSSRLQFIVPYLFA